MDVEEKKGAFLGNKKVHSRPWRRMDMIRCELKVQKVGGYLLFFGAWY